MKKILAVIIITISGIAGFAADFSSFKTENGQNVIIQEVHDNPIVIIDTWIKTGSIDETDENNGVAHFLEHLFFKGTSNHPSKEFDNILESKGAITNAATSKDFTHYYILIPSEYFELALDLHADMLLNPMIPRKELEKERKVVLEEIAKNNDKPATHLYRNMIKSFYKNHPYKRDVIGTKNVIETISREQILDFYKTRYTPQNMTTVIIGDVNTQKAYDAVKAYFGKAQIKNTKQKSEEYKVDKRPTEQTEVKEEMKIESGYILIGFKGAKSVNEKDSYALDVLATILGEGKSSRLYRELKEQKQIVNAADAVNSSMKDDSIFYISANYNTSDIENLKKSVFDEIKKIRENEISADELKKAKSIIERDTFYSRESISNIAAEIGYTVTITGDTSYYKNYIDNINKVSASDIKRVAREYLNPEYAVISIIMPDKKGNANVDNTKIDNKPVNHEAKIISQNNDTTKYLLDNGATLVITKNDSNDIIALEMAARGGNNLEKIPGTALITASAIMKGTQKYRNAELSRLLEENGITVVPYSKGDSFGISAKFTKNEKDLALNIFKDVTKNALLDSYDIEKVKNDRLNAVRNRKNTPDTLAFDEFKTSLWQGTPFGNTGKVLENTLPKITDNDVIEYYNSLFPAQDTYITINGNADAQEYINYFSELLKTGKNKKIDLSDYKNKYLPLNQNKIGKTATDSQATWLLFGWYTDGLTNKKDWASLQVINAILGSGMSSRMFTNLRDEMGLAYQVGSTFSANYNRGVFGLYIATNPDNTSIAKQGMLKEIDKLKHEFVTDKELEEAKDKIRGNFVLSMETNSDKASTINSFELSGRGYEFTTELPALINSVTVQDVIRTANKYFSKPYVFTAVGNAKSVEKL